jgi:uncharacterized repeat protein (TIGR01451 family)
MKLLLKRSNAIIQLDRLSATMQAAKLARSLEPSSKSSILNSQRLRWLQSVLIGFGTVALGVLAPSTAHALAAGSVTIQMVTDDQLVVDSNYCSGNQGPRAAYVGFKITNTTGAAINNLQVDLATLTNGFSLAGGQVSNQYVGTLAAGASRTVYWYVQYVISCSGGGGFTPIASTLTVTAKDANAGTVSGTGNIQTTSYISASAGGQIASSVLGPGYVAGQLIPYDVTYSFGGANSGDRYNLQPAGNLTYNAACFQLEKSQILSSAVTAIPTGTVDQLFFTASTNQPGSGYNVQVRYYIRYLCANTSTTAKPYAGQTSGSNNKKYTGNYETWIATSFPTATNAFTISKSASVSNLPAGGSVTYTVTITNTSPYDARIDKIVDTLPTGVTFTGISASSNVTAANSSSSPTVGATGTLTWIGQPPNYYSVPANSSIKLIYTATILNTPGSYQNVVNATTGNTTTATASTTVTVGTILSVSGKVWDDADNSANNTFTNINTGTETGTNAGGLYAILVSALGTVIGSTPVNADGTYTFTNILSGQTNLSIRLSTTPGTLGSAAPASSIPANWTNTSPLTQTAFNLGISNISGKDFGIEQLPNTNDVTAASQNNPGVTNTVQVSALSGTDPEDGSLGTGKSFKIVTLPTNGTLYYNGVAITAGQVISNYDPTKLTLDPNDGTLTVSFTYAAIDAAGKEDPTPATLSMSFTAVVSISGNVFNDANGSKIQNGTELGTNAGGLNAVLIDSTNKVVAIASVAANGTYSFSNIPGNATYTVEITTATAIVGAAPPSVTLPTNWVSTGENLNGTPDATVDGKVSVTTAIGNVTGVNLGIEQLPDTNAVTTTSQTNPGGTAQVTVPALSGTDPEDGTLGTGQSFKIVTLPTDGTLYYNGVAVTAGQVISNYDPTKLTLDPNDGALTVSFTYAAIDAAGQVDATPATVAMPFSVPTVTVAGKVWDDADNSANNTFTNINTGTETGTNAGSLYAILINASGNVIASTLVNADGTYSFSNILSSQSNVTIRLSTTVGTVGSAAPTSSLPANWTNTSPLTQTAFNIGISNISSKDFGIEQLPDTNAVTATSQTNPGGTGIVQVPTLSGTDPEDGSLGTGRSFKIVTLPTNGTLYYNGVAVTAGQVINNYDPTKLTLDPNDGALTASFTYVAIDAAGKEDPTPATVSMPFAASTADLSVTKTDGQTSMTAGNSIAYTITVTNNGPSTVTSLTLTDPLPASIQSPSFTPSTGTYNSSTGAWTGLNLASGQSITLTINATVSNSAAVGTLTNTATVAPPSGVIDPTSSNNTATDTTYVYAIAPTAGRIVINEVLYAQTGGTTLDGNDEFIELYNASGTTVDLSNWKLADGNLIENSTDGVGSITGSSSPYIFPTGTTLAPGQYAVIWIGNNTTDHQATGAAFQTWLGQTPKLNNAGDDIWLYDAQMRIVDYVAYGVNNGINTPPPASLNLWNSTYQSSLAGVSTGQSISLTPNGQDSNTSACWEPSTSGQASGRCTGYLATRDTDTVVSRITSVGVNNNVVVASPPNLLLVKRITAINGVNVTTIVDDPGSTNDNAVNWPLPLNAANSISTYLRGAIDGGVVRPNDILEYTIYFLSNGGSPVTNVNLCDLVPANSTFMPTSFSSSPESGISLSIGSTTTNLTNVPDADGGEYFAPRAIPSVTCSATNTNGAVMVRVVQSPANLPNATAPGTPNSYGFIRFRARVN